MPSEVRVLHFYRTALPDSMGGTEQVMHQLGSSSGKHNVVIEVLSLSRNSVPQTLDMGGYRVHRARLDFQIASTGFSASAFRHFAQLASTVDVIHYHFPWPFMDLVHFATRINKPTLVTYHSDIIRQKSLLKLYRPLMRKFLRSVDSIVATSPNYLATSEVLKDYRDKVSVIPIGLDRDTYPEPDPASLEHWRARFGPRFFLFVGVLRYYKGLHILIEAAQGIDYPIVIVGAGPIETELKDQAARLGLHNVHFLGHVTDLDKVALLTLCYAVVFPSHLRSEAFGISLLEGAMYGKPLISSEIGTGTSYINVAGKTGLVVPPSDPQALRAAMQFLWEHPVEATGMGAQARARYEQYFTADEMMAAYAKLYRHLLTK